MQLVQQKRHHAKTHLSLTENARGSKTTSKGNKKMALVSPFSVNFASTDAQKLILILLVIMVVAVTIEGLAGKPPVSYVEIWVATFILGLMLEAISYVLPEFAVGLALVATLTVLLTKGQIFFGALSHAATNPTTTPNEATTSTSTSATTTNSSNTTGGNANGKG